MSVGCEPSILMVAAFSASTLPALSVARYSSVWLPSPVTSTAAVYGVHAPPSSLYSIVVDALALVGRRQQHRDGARVPAGRRPASANVAVVTGAASSTISLIWTFRNQTSSPSPWFWMPTNPCVRSRAGSVLVKSLISTPLSRTLMVWPCTTIS